MMVVDASALLAFLFREPGHEHAAPYLRNALMSTVNLGEVIGRFARDGHDVAPIKAMLFGTPIQWIPFDVEQAEEVARLLPRTRALGLSFADRACLALGILRNTPVLTANKAWLSADIGVDVRYIR